MTRHGHDYLVGCVSLSMHDAGKNAARVCREVTQQYPAPSAWRVTPHHPMALDLIDDGAAARLPPLVKGYTRLGALVCGPPAWDRDFNTAGLLMLLPMVQLNRRYARWLLR